MNIPDGISEETVGVYLILQNHFDKRNFPTAAEKMSSSHHYISMVLIIFRNEQRIETDKNPFWRICSSRAKLLKKVALLVETMPAHRQVQHFDRVSLHVSREDSDKSLLIIKAVTEHVR